MLILSLEDDNKLHSKTQAKHIEKSVEVKLCIKVL